MPIEKKKILVIGDSRHNQDIFQESLQNYTLVFLEKKEDVFEALQNDPSQLVIIDYTLPSGENGLDLIKEINQLTENQAPTILLIEEGFEKIAVAAMKEGVSDYLIKSELVPSILMMSVRRAMEHKKWECLHYNLLNGNSGSYLKDPITDVYNKCYLKTRLTEEMARSKRYNFPITMILFDVDQFDHIRKKYGTQAGNWALKELGQLIGRNIRSSDLIARIKGDQFTILLPHTSLDDARAVWKRITKHVLEFPFTIQEDNIYITLRGALTPLNKEIEALDILLKNIEEFLEQNKDKETKQPLLLYLKE